MSRGIAPRCLHVSKIRPPTLGGGAPEAPFVVSLRTGGSRASPRSPVPTGNASGGKPRSIALSASCVKALGGHEGTAGSMHSRRPGLSPEPVGRGQRWAQRAPAPGADARSGPRGLRNPEPERSATRSRGTPRRERAIRAVRTGHRHHEQGARRTGLGPFSDWPIRYFWRDAEPRQSRPDRAPSSRGLPAPARHRTPARS